MTSASARPLDYAIIGFTAELKRRPRPELMDAVRSKHDKARIIWFRDGNKMGVPRLREGMERCFKEKHIEYQGCTTTADMVRFHLVQKEDVRALKNRLPVVGGNECVMGTPKFIQPNYALEIGIVGIDSPLSS